MFAQTHLRPLPSAAAIATVGAASIAGVAAALDPKFLLVAIVLLAASVLVVRPELAIVPVVFLMFTNTPAVLAQYHGVPQSLAAFVPLLLMLPICAAVLRHEAVVVTPVLVLLLVYLVVQILATVGAAEMNVAVSRLQTFVFEGVVIYFLFTNAVRTRSALRLATWTLIVAGSFLGALTLFQYVTKTFYSPYFGFAQVSEDYFYGLVPDPRLQGPIGDPNYYAQVLLIAMPLALLQAFGATSSRVRIAAIAATVATSAGIILTYSRGAVVAIALVFVFMVVVREVKVRHALFAAAIAVCVVMAIPSYRDRVTSLGGVAAAGASQGAQAAPDQSVQSRSTEMKAALLAFFDHPLVGVGPGQFPIHYQEYAARVGGAVHTRVRTGPDKGATPERQAHNTFLGITAEYGALGIVLFLAILGASARSLWRVRVSRRWDDPALAAQAAGYLLALAAYLSAGLFLSLAYERYLWMLLALGAAVVRLGESRADGVLAPETSGRLPHASPASRATPRRRRPAAVTPAKTGP